MKLSLPKATSGVALVITLIMLSVVTIVAVAFLAVARRERAAVSAADEQTDARYFAEAALARAQADVASRMAASGSRVDFGAVSSTNYYRVAGFDPSIQPADPFKPYGANPVNTSYTNVNGVPLIPGDSRTPVDQLRESLGNLLYDPRPPVFVTTNAIRGAPSDFRFYVDLNRNGYFEPPRESVANLGKFNGIDVLQTNRIPGDPQWIGILEHPHLPHSATNRFLGRIAYLIVPTALDFNYAHNRAKNLGSTESFLRNQGIGSWELNLAAALNQVDSGIWSNYTFNAGVAASSPGLAFADANAIVRRRLAGLSLNSVEQFLEPARFHPDAQPLQGTFLDLVANGPIVRSTTLPPATDNLADRNLAWDGSDTTQHFQTFQDLFYVSTGFSNRIRGSVRRATASPTNDWTLYRLLSDVGTDSPDGRFYSAYDSKKGHYRRAKLNLNFAHGEDGEVQVPSSTRTGTGTFRPWQPLEFFTNAVDRLLEGGLHFQGVTFHADRVPVRYFGVTAVTNPLGSSRRVTWITNQVSYGADIHRLLQLAANIYDASQNRSNKEPVTAGLPTVFRPRFAYVADRFEIEGGGVIVTNNLYIVGWQEVTNATPLSYEWLDPDNAVQLRANLATNPAVGLNTAYTASTDVNLHGVPWVIGARKGFPSFNEAFWQTQIGVTRRVKLSKSRPETQYPTNLATGRPVGGTFFTNVQYLIDVNRRGSIEAWNSYAADYARPYRMVVSNLFCLGFSNYVDGQYRSLVPDVAGDLVNQRLLRVQFTNVIDSGTPWPGSKQADGSSTSFQVPIDFVTGGKALTNRLVFVPPGALAAASAPSGQLLDLSDVRNKRFESVYYPAIYTNSTPNLAVAMTNYLFYAMIDKASGRVVDFVNLKSVALETNILTWMAVTNQGDNFLGVAPRRPGETFHDGHLWMTNIPSRNAPGITAGLTNQILASSVDQRNVTADIYRSFDQTARDKERAVANFRYFLYRDAVEAEWKALGDYNMRTNLSVDAIAPTRQFTLTDRRAVNDPLVHYTLEDLRPGPLWLVSRGAGKVPGLNSNQFGSNLKVAMSQRKPTTFAPWGKAPLYAGAAPSGAYATDPRFKDPGIQRSDDWDFPVHTLPTLGWLGRIHRGTPWQTVYLKSGIAALGDNPAVLPSTDATWSPWAGFRANQSINFYVPALLATNLNSTTEPSGDWNLVHLFTTAYNDNAARGLQPVNGSGHAGWAAVLAGVNVLRPNGTDTFIDPTSVEFANIVTNINYTRTVFTPQGAFTNLGGVFASPSLTVESPYLTGWNNSVRTNSDAIVERIPQQVLGLLREPQPHFVVYAFGQSLKPAPGSLVTAPGPYFGLCQNYQITGEYVTKSVIRFDGAATNLQAVVERHVTVPAQ